MVEKKGKETIQRHCSVIAREMVGIVQLLSKHVHYTESSLVQAVHLVSTLMWNLDITNLYITKSSLKRNDIIHPSTVEPRYNEPLYNEVLVKTKRYSSPQHSGTSI